MKKTITGLLACALGTMCFAEQLFYESFDYSAGGSIGGQKGGEGFGANRWSDKSGSKGDAYVSWSGLSFADMPVSGSALLVDMSANPKGSGISITRGVGKGLSSGTLWVSFLYKYGGDTSDDFVKNLTSYIYFQSKSDKSIRLRMLFNNLNSGGVGIRQSGQKSQEGESRRPSIADGNVYLIICSFPELGTAAGGQPQIWALSESGYTNLKAAAAGGSVTPEILTANAVTQARGSRAPAVLKDDDVMVLGLWAREANTKFSIEFDELRAGTALSDVLGF